MATTARRDGDAYMLEGEKAWITNAPIADLAVVFAKARNLSPAESAPACLPSTRGHTRHWRSTASEEWQRCLAGSPASCRVIDEDRRLYNL